MGRREILVSLAPFLQRCVFTHPGSAAQPLTLGKLAKPTSAIHARARITHAPYAYRTHATHVSHTRNARIKHMLRMYHVCTMRISNTCYACITYAPYEYAYRTHATYVSHTHHARIKRMLRMHRACYSNLWIRHAPSSSRQTRGVTKNAGG